APQAMDRTRLSGRTGAAMDPCGALQTVFDLSAGQEHEVIFMLGASVGMDETIRLIQEFKVPGAAYAALLEVYHYWEHALGALKIETPESSVNMLGNGWLLYQTLACRFMARSGFYQSGGAYGFRDQLQDSL